MQKNTIPLTGYGVILTVFLLASCGQGPQTPTPKPTIKAQTASEIQSTIPKPAVKTIENTTSRGKKLFARCRACHTINEGGKHRVGPNLWKIFDKKAGTAEKYAYSKAMLASDIVWSEENLDGYLTNPRVFMPKNKMAFVGLRKAEDRAALLAYLKENTAPQTVATP